MLLVAGLGGADPLRPDKSGLVPLNEGDKGRRAGALKSNKGFFVG
jgi:hypothetical protein